MKPVTIMVLTYGNYTKLAKDCVGSILKYFDKSLYNIFISLNGCCEETTKYIKSLTVDKIFEYDPAINKYITMRDMIQNCDTEYLWWFDDDCIITDSNPLEYRIKYMQENINISVVGHMYFIPKLMHYKRWFQKQPWYQGFDEPSGHQEIGDLPANERWFFITGCQWFARTQIIKFIAWPDEEFINKIGKAGDVIMCAKLRHLGYPFRQVSSKGILENVVGNRNPLSKKNKK